MGEEFKDLVKRAKKGDRHSFALLYSGIYKELYRYALFTLRNEQDAEDCVSDAVIDAYKTIGNLKNEDKFKAWFFKILSCKCKQKIKSYANAPVGSFYFESSEPDFDTSIDLKNAFLALSFEERMIISLRLFGGYSSKETAKMLKMNANTVRSKYSRSLEKLRTMMSFTQNKEVYDE